MAEGYDIVGFGVATIDDVYIVDEFPVPDTKRRYLAASRFGGGLTATAMVAASRLGCRCRWCGKLGANELSDFIRAVFCREGIDFADDASFPEAEPIHSIIINDRRDGGRTIMWNDDNYATPMPDEADLAHVDAATCLFVDQIRPEPQVAAARRARSRGIPVVADLEELTSPAVRELAELANHLIVPLAALRERYGDAAPESLATKALGIGGKDLVCVTDGPNGAWFVLATEPGEVFHQPAFIMEKVVDTNGCGDVFHGAYAAALVKNLEPRERIRWAAAAAALKTQAIGGQAGTPTLEKLLTFLR